MSPDERTRTAAPSRRVRIAVLDDDDDFASVVRDMLGAEGGYDVDVHRRWEDAAAFVKAHRPDLVILDVLFGGEQHGLSILLQLKEDPATRHIPVVACSADPASLRSYRALLAHDDVPAIEKPFEVDEFLRLIEEALAGRGRGPASP